MSKMNENRNLISMRQRRMIRQLNKELQAKRDRREAARKVFTVIMMVCVMILGLLIMVGAAEIRAAEEAQAAVLRRHRITSQNITAQYPHSPNAGLQAEDPYMVESLPAEAPDHGEPPEAIEIIKKEATAAEAVPAERWESMGTYRLTFYCPCYQCSEGWGHKTASGATAVEGVTVAVDPRLIPYGTHLQINGHEYIAQDCGGSIKGRRIDIFMESHQECLRNGIQKAEVFIKR